MKRYWLLFGFVLCVSLLFAQNRADYDTKDYEPIKLKAYKTHPKATIPEEVELEPESELAKKETTNVVIAKPQITIKEEPKIDTKSNIGSQNGSIDNKIQSDKSPKNEETENYFVFLPQGKSKAFKINPVEGVTISAEENALDKDREFTMKALSEEKVASFSDLLNNEKMETGCVVDAWELHAGLKDNEILPGSFKMEFDLEKIGVLPEFYENVVCYRVDDKGNWSEFPTHIDGKRATLDSNQNSSFMLAVVDTVGLSMDGDGNIMISNPKDAKDKGQDYISIKNEWLVKNNDYKDLQIKIHYDEILKKYNVDFNQLKYSSSGLLEIYSSTKNSKEIDEIMNQYRYNKYNKQLREKHIFEILKKNDYFINIAKYLANSYKKVMDIKQSICSCFQNVLDYYCLEIFPKGLKHPTGTVNVYFQDSYMGRNISAIAVTITNPHTDVIAATNPAIYIGLGLIKDNNENLLLTIAHEFFHVIQRAKYSAFPDNRWAEATAQYFEEEAFNWFTKTNKLPANFDSEGKELGLRYEYYGYPVNIYSGNIEGKPFSLSGEDAANTGYPLWNFIKYVWKKEKKTEKPENWDDILICLKNDNGYFSNLFKYTFRDSSDQMMTDLKMTEYYKNFAKENSEKIFSRISNINGEDKELLLLTAINSMGNNGLHIDLLNEEYTIRVREISNVAKSDYKKKNGKPKEIAMHIVFDDDLQVTLFDRDFKPVGSDKNTKTKKGRFYFPQEPKENKKYNKLSNEDTLKFKKYKKELEKTMDPKEAQKLADKKFNRIADIYFQKDFYILEIDGGNDKQTIVPRKGNNNTSFGSYGDLISKTSGYTIWSMFAPELEEKPLDFEMVEEIVNGKKQKVEKVRLQLPSKSEAALSGKCVDGYIVKIQVDKGEKIEKYFEIDKIKDQKVYFDFEEIKPKDLEPNEPVTGKVIIAEYVLSNDDKKLEGPESEEVEFVLNNSLIIEMVKCPAGSFMMGSSKDELRVIAMEKDEELLHKVTISKPFYIGKYEVTQEQYEKVMGNNPSLNKCASAPVEMVTWEDAEKFCEVLNARFAYTIPEKGYKYALPTEAQWEYACRAGTTSSLNSGKEILEDKAITKNVERDKKLDEALAKAGPSDKAIAFIGEQKMNNTADLYKNLLNLKSDNLDEVAWYKHNSKRKTHPVGLKKPNAWGIYDMHGNAGEFCGDWYYEYTEKAVTDPVGKKSSDPKLQGRVIRGGSFGEIAMNCRSGFRAFMPESSPHPDYTAYVRKGVGLGFRVVLIPVE